MECIRRSILKRNKNFLRRENYADLVEGIYVKGELLLPQKIRRMIFMMNEKMQF